MDRVLIFAFQALCFYKGITLTLPFLEIQQATIMHLFPCDICSLAVWADRGLEIELPCFYV
jgi:hypothetical protein